MVYLDNSATSYPKPACVYNDYKNAIKSYFSNPGRGGYANALKTADKVYEVRCRLAEFFGCCDERNVVFTQNCTMAINMVLKGFLHRGDHVLISDLEHNSVVRSLESMRQNSGIKYDVFETSIYDDFRTLQNIQKRILPETAMIICTHASNVFGYTLPIELIGNLCHRLNIVFAVDAAQSAGILPIDMQKCKIHFLCIAAHKGLFAPMGLGVLLTDGTALSSFAQGGTGSQSLSFVQPDIMPDKLEVGTLNVPAIIALGSGLDYINRVGIDEIRTKEKQHIKKIYHFLQEKGFSVYCDYDKIREYSPVLSFNIPNAASESVASELAKKQIYLRAGLHCAPLAHKKIGTLKTGTVRIAPSFFTKKSEINYVINTMKKLF